MAQIVLVAVGTAFYSVFKLVTVQEIYSDLHANIELFISTLCFVLVGAAFVLLVDNVEVEVVEGENFAYLVEELAAAVVIETPGQFAEGHV